MRPGRVGVEETAGNRWIPCFGKMLQQDIGDPALRGQTRVDLAGAKEVTYHLPAINPVQTPAGHAGEDIEAQLLLIETGEEHQWCSSAGV